MCFCVVAQLFVQGGGGGGFPVLYNIRLLDVYYTAVLNSSVKLNIVQRGNILIDLFYFNILRLVDFLSLVYKVSSIFYFHETLVFFNISIKEIACEIFKVLDMPGWNIRFR